MLGSATCARAHAHSPDSAALPLPPRERRPGHTARRAAAQVLLAVEEMLDAREDEADQLRVQLRAEQTEHEEVRPRSRTPQPRPPTRPSRRPSVAGARGG